MVTFHPVTLGEELPREQFSKLLAALDNLGSEVGLIFTKPNSDTGGRVIIQMIDDYVEHHPNAKAYVSLGDLLYLNAIVHTDVVVGNSSSGLYEVPSFCKPTVNIGDRQKGRVMATSVITCRIETEAIVEAIQQAFTMDCSETVNPYGDGEACA